MSTRATLGLIAAVAETVLPGEERALEPGVLGEGAVAWLQHLPPETPLVLVTVTALAEVPLLVTGRFATRVVHQGFDDGKPRFLGQARVKLLSVRGSRIPFEADCDLAPAPAVSRLPELVLRAVAALHHGPPLSPQPDVTPLAAAALRAVGGPNAARQALTTGDIEQALEQATHGFLAEARGRAAVTELEEHVRALAEKTALGKPLRQRLHSAVVEISRRLDVYDTHRAKDHDHDELDLLQRKLEQSGLPVDARAMAERELGLLRDMKKDHHDYASHLRLLQLLARLSWIPDVLPPIDLGRVKSILDRDHAGLERPKRRILEHLAVKVLGGEGRATVLCLAGPPGVGKTSLAKAMAEAMGRPFVRVALGGVYDQSELRGHRITYIGARPGRLIDGLANVRSRSALVLLDELDKLGTDRSRDAVGPLLEILDPEQNHSFSDNFLSVPYDLSDCFFVATANDLSRVPDYLRDRLEVIELDGYTTAEKVQIARSHLAAGLGREHGISPLSISDDTVAAIVEGWTREAGVRQLRRELSALYRARALQQVLGAATPLDQAAQSRCEPAVDLAHLVPVLGPRRFKPPIRSDKPAAGIATGLSVAAHGGQTLPIEIVRVGTSDKAPGRLGMTGSLGAVIKESAETVRAHLMAYRAAYGLPDEVFAWDLHLHAPEAAVPKDGPSAGIAIFLAQLSLLTGRPVRADVAATGELTLSGQVLPVGGVRAKCLAAEQAQMGLVLLPRGNEADVPADLKIPVTFIERAEDAIVALS